MTHERSFKFKKNERVLFPKFKIICICWVSYKNTLKTCEKNIAKKKYWKKFGDAGYRSPYFSHARRALYHLNYIPYYWNVINLPLLKQSQRKISRSLLKSSVSPKTLYVNAEQFYNLIPQWRVLLLLIGGSKKSLNRTVCCSQENYNDEKLRVDQYCSK